jgi:hypothetical protein
MRTVPLTMLKGGINRQRIKGGARADSLYDLVNGHLTDAGTAKSRPGTLRMAVLPSSTKGLVSFDGTIHVFSHETGDVPAGYTRHVLTHPDPPTDEVPEITAIHFAAPFLGFLYVVAEFTGGDVFHFWQRASGEWEADTIYNAGDVVTPTDPNGLSYEATRFGQPYPAWAPNVPRTLNDIIEPTVYNDFYYTAIDVLGTNTISGPTEPVWSTEDGGLTYESGDSNSQTPPAPNPGPNPNATPASTQERYE